MKRKIWVAFEFLVEADNEEQYRKAVKSIRKEPFTSSWCSSGYEYKRTNKSHEVEIQK